ncbi:uncharacterized protein LOC111054200 [Nilaparvata lugens]|uniref:uncharacterized protein LOC111054200 n=1 Tax=Nilaparvata lugens TaxID=108931 RepID=UPI00193C9CF6|nr:uncharacterized protein LOC111054200 [Nilaparvata lugens]
MNFKSDSFYGEESCCSKAKTNFIIGLSSPFNTAIDNIIEFISILLSDKFYHAIPSLIIIVTVWLLFNHKTRNTIRKMNNGNNKLRIVFKILMTTPVVQVSLFSWLRCQEFLYCIISRFVILATNYFPTDYEQIEHTYLLNSLFFNRKNNEPRPFTELLCCSIAISMASYILYSTVRKLRSSDTIVEKVFTRIEPDDGLSIIYKNNGKRFTSSKNNKYSKNSQDDGNDNVKDNISRMLTRARTRSNTQLPDVIATNEASN